MLKSAALFILLILNHLSYGQAPFRLSFNHLTRENGLSNNNIFYFHTDSRGFTWMGSLNGLNRFDGINVKVYKPYNSSIVGIKINNIVEDKSGGLWIGSEKGLNFYDRAKDGFVTHLSPDKKSFYAYPIRFDHHGLLWLTVNGTQRDGLYTYNTKTKQYSFITNDIFDHISKNHLANYTPVNTLYTSTKEGFGIKKLSFENNKLLKTQTYFDGKNGLAKLQNLADFVFVESDSIIWITGNNNGLSKLNTNTLKLQNFTKFEEKPITTVLSQMSQYKNFLFVGSNDGLYIFDRKLMRFVQHLKHSKLNSNGLQHAWNEVPYIDSHGNLFLSQLGVGVDFTNIHRNVASSWLTPEEIATLGYTDNHVSRIVKNQDFVIAKLQNGGSIQLDKNGKVLKDLGKRTPLFTDSENQTWLTNGLNFVRYNPTKNSNKIVTVDALAGNMGWNPLGTETEPGEYLLAGQTGLFRYLDKNNNFTQIDDLKDKNINIFNFLYYDKATKQVFISSNWWSRIFVLEKIGENWRLKKELLLGKDIYSFMPSVQKNKIWLGSNKGLLLFNTQNFSYQTYDEKMGLPDNNVTDIIEEPNGNYWLVTNKGISYFSKSKNEFRSFTSKDGAYSHEYDWGCAFKLSNGKVIFGGTDGITAIEETRSKSNYLPPKVEITQLIINEKQVRLGSYSKENQTIELKPSENTFSLDLVGIDYGFPEKVQLQYQLQGYDKQWIMGKNPTSARYVNVNEGHYTFMVKAISEDGRTSSKTKRIGIIVHAPYYRTVWFRTLLILALGGLAYFLSRLRIMQIREETKKKEEIRRIKVEAEINALRSQMNPHFIFNCLNTIDSYILLNKTDEASEFLNKFSKLIRMILENSRQEFIPLGQDLKALELYIKLEQERSNPRFEYKISVSESLLKEEYYLPSMLFQPFVENAILHGLRHKKDGKPMLILDFECSQKQLFIQIADNGIGREQSQKLNEQNTLKRHSLGMKVTQERIEKLNEIYAQKIILQIEDNFEKSKTGTTISISLPLLTHSDLIL